MIENKPVISAILYRIVGRAEQTRWKLEQGKHWEGELYQECCEIAAAARELCQLTEKR